MCVCVCMFAVGVGVGVPTPCCVPCCAWGVGAVTTAGGTGDGDTMVRFVPCYQAVESMARGMTPRAAATDAISRILKFYPAFGGAVVVVNAAGVHSAACSTGLGASWRYTFRASGMEKHGVVEVPCQSI